MMEEILKGVGLGLVGLFFGLGVYALKRWREAQAAERRLAIEIGEREAHEKIDAKDPDSLIDDINKWQANEKLRPK